MGKHVEELWAPLKKKGGACFLKKVATEHFHPVVLRAFGVYEAFSI